MGKLYYNKNGKPSRWNKIFKIALLVFIVILLILPLTACGSVKEAFAPVLGVQNIEAQYEKEKPPITVAKPSLMPWEWEVPRNMDVLEVYRRASADCRDVPDQPMDGMSSRLRNLCYRHPPLSEEKTGIFLGLTREEYNNYKINDVRIQAYLYELEQAIKRENEDRSKIAERNAAEERRVECEKKKVQNNGQLTEDCKTIAVPSINE